MSINLYLLLETTRFEPKRPRPVVTARGKSGWAPLKPRRRPAWRSASRRGGWSRREFLKHPALGLDGEEESHQTADQSDGGEGRKHVADSEVADDPADQDRAD